MKRDLDLARLLLLEIESCESAWGLDESPEIPGYEREQIAYHIKLLNEAGLIDAEDCSSMGPGGFDWSPGSLTWYGHEFLDAARDATIWNKSKETIIKTSTSMTFDILLEFLKMKVKEKIGIL